MNPAPPVTSTRSPTRRRLRVRHRGAAACLLAATAVAGCGGGGASAPRRAAEPAESPPLRSAPSGASVAVGHEPEGVAWDAAAGLIAVGVRQPAQVVFVDPASLKVVRRVALPAPPRHLSYDIAAGTVLVPAEPANELLVVRPNGIVTATKVGTHPHDATSVGGNVFVADEHSDQVTVLREGHVIETLPAPHQPGGIAAVSERWIALVAVSARVLQIYGVHSLEPLGRVAAGVGPSHIVSRAGYAYVADTQGDRILTYEVRAQPRLVARTHIPGTPYGLGVDVVRGRLWVTSTATDRIAEYKLRPLPQLIATYPTLRQPNSVAVDERTGQVFVAGRDSGRLERIAPRRDRTR
jgi:DNA-binding beta-propeller fold protein YncE